MLIRRTDIVGKMSVIRTEIKQIDIVSKPSRPKHLLYEPSLDKSTWYPAKRLLQIDVELVQSQHCSHFLSLVLE